jgi:hypothetical protein
VIPDVNAEYYLPPSNCDGTEVCEDYGLDFIYNFSYYNKGTEDAYANLCLREASTNIPSNVTFEWSFKSIYGLCLKFTENRSYTIALSMINDCGLKCTVTKEIEVTGIKKNECRVIVNYSTSLN